MITDRDIAGRFNARVGRRHRTLLLGGAAEPEYLPGNADSPAIIRYTGDYAQSALHEICHWCVAGTARRALRDYGYWYVPPPRSSTEQAAFFAAEERTQALESVMADACGLRFHVSADQIGADIEEFAARVSRRAACIRARGISGRAAEVLDALCGAAARHSVREG